MSTTAHPDTLNNEAAVQPLTARKTWKALTGLEGRIIGMRTFGGLGTAQGTAEEVRAPPRRGCRCSERTAR